jgi:DNA primase catalytic core
VTITPERTIEINQLAWECWRYHVRTDDDWTRDYLSNVRGLRGVQAGFAPDGWARLVLTLRKKGVDDAELEAAGLAMRSTSGSLGDVFRNRLVLPIRDASDRIIGFTARRHPNEDREVEGKRQPPKYLNTTTTPVFTKSEVLYGLDRSAVRRLAEGASLVPVEGALDVEAVARVGQDYVPAAPLGTAWTQAHLRLLREIEPSVLERMVTATDADSAGMKSAVDLWEMLTPSEAGAASAAVLPTDMDPADMVKHGQQNQLRDALYVAGPLTHAVVDHRLTEHRLDHVEGRVAAVRRLAADLVRLEPHPLAGAAMHLAGRLQVEEPRGVHELVVAEVITAVRSTPVPAAPREPDAVPVRDVVADVAKMRNINGYTTAPTPVRAAPSQEPGPAPPAHQTRTQQNPIQSPIQER